MLGLAINLFTSAIRGANIGAGAGEIGYEETAADEVLWSDSTPVLWSDGSFMEWSA